MTNPFVCPRCGANAEPLPDDPLHCPTCAPLQSTPPRAAGWPEPPDSDEAAVRPRRRRVAAVLAVAAVGLGLVAAISLGLGWLAPPPVPPVDIEGNDAAALRLLAQLQTDRTSGLAADQRLGGIGAVAPLVRQRSLSDGVRRQLIRFLVEAEREEDIEISETAGDALGTLGQPRAPRPASRRGRVP